MIGALLLGLSYGLAAGLSPGPMLGLVITQTLQRGWRAGNIVALAPLLSDAPVVLLAVTVVPLLPPGALDWLSIAGGGFVLWLAAETLGAARHVSDDFQTPSGASDAPLKVLLRAVATNLLNPHPYLFWSTAGAGLLGVAYRSGAGAVVLLLLAFYAVLVGSKLALAFLIHSGRGWLNRRRYQIILVGSGVVLALLGLGLIWEGSATLRAGKDAQRYDRIYAGGADPSHHRGNIYFADTDG